VAFIACVHQALFLALSLILAGISPPPHTKIESPPNNCQMVCSKSFFRDNQLQIYHGNFKWTINTGNYSSLSNQKGANLCRECTEIIVAAELRPNPDPLAAMGYIYLFTEGGRMSRRRHCSKDGQPVPKAVYRSACRNKHNCLRRDSSHTAIRRANQ